MAKSLCFLRVLWLLGLFALPLAAQVEAAFPDGCDNPFIGDGTFGDFYEKAIRASVIENGSVSAAHVSLFAVNSIRREVAARYPSPTDGELIDRHIRAQLCQFVTDKANIKSTDVALHRFLNQISSKLLRDVTRLATDLVAKERERQKLVAKFEARTGLVEKAESLGDAEAAKILK